MQTLETKIIEYGVDELTVKAKVHYIMEPYSGNDPDSEIMLPTIHGVDVMIENQWVSIDFEGDLYDCQIEDLTSELREEVCYA